jgi:hypothetical protein
MDCFRFENMDIWKDAISISDLLFDYADKAEEKRFYKFAEQLRAATMLFAPHPMPSSWGCGFSPLLSPTAFFNKSDHKNNVLYDKGNKHTAISHPWHLTCKNANAINELVVSFSPEFNPQN